MIRVDDFQESGDVVENGGGGNDQDHSDGPVHVAHPRHLGQGQQVEPTCTTGLPFRSFDSLAHVLCSVVKPFHVSHYSGSILSLNFLIWTTYEENRLVRVQTSDAFWRSVLNGLSNHIVLYDI